ncbi:hypothetical protein EVG20_g4877, partial [Dentipellis fragilis]
MVTPRDLNRVPARLGHLNGTRAQDFHFPSFQAYHRDLVQPAPPQSAPPLHADAPAWLHQSSALPRNATQASTSPFSSTSPSSPGLMAL